MKNRERENKERERAEETTHRRCVEIKPHP